MTEFKFITIFYLTWLFVFRNNAAFSQKTINEDDQQWVQYYTETQLKKNLFFNADAGVRFGEQFSELRAALARVGVGYNVLKPVRGVSGAALFSFFEDFKINRLEIRPYQDFTGSSVIGKGILRHRFRTEGRYFLNYNNNGVQSGSEFYFRLRYHLNFLYPLLAFSKSKPDRKLLLNVADEIFINAGQAIVYNMFDNNRLICGLAYQENPDLRISLLYNFQFGQRNAPADYNLSHIIWLTINHRISRKID